MNVEIADIIKGKIDTLPFVDRITGLVKAISYKENKGEKGIITKTFPVGCGVTHADCLKGKFTDLIPNSAYKSIIYFEDGGVIPASNNQQTFAFESRLKLVCWLNMQKLGKTSCGISGLALGAILKQLPTNYFNEGSFDRIQIQMTGEDIKAASIFSKYTYDETETQYLMYPYDYFAMNFVTKFTLNKSCIDSFVNGTAITCNDNENV